MAPACCCSVGRKEYPLSGRDGSIRPVTRPLDYGLNPAESKKKRRSVEPPRFAAEMDWSIELVPWKIARTDQLTSIVSESAPPFVEVEYLFLEIVIRWGVGAARQIQDFPASMHVIKEYQRAAPERRRPPPTRAAGGDRSCRSTTVQVTAPCPGSARWA